jgi:hypothetical protein
VAEIDFEYLALALEATKGTAVTPPTHYAMLRGAVTPVRDKFRPNESRGTLAEFYRSTTVRELANWTGTAGLDNYILPVFLNMLVKGGVTSPTTPTNGVLTRLWSFAPTMTSDDLKSATLYWGDPNVQIFQSAFAMADTLTIAADASGTDGVTMTVSGMGKFPAKVSAPTLPTQLVSPLFVPGEMQLWVDSGSDAIGTTAITGRFVSANATIPSGVTYKYLAGGPGSKSYSRTGRVKRHAEMTLVFELLDAAQYDLWAADTSLKVRLRINGPLIESVTPDYYHYVEMDIYGPFDAVSWGELEGSNRTVSLTIQSEYNSTAGHDFAVRVQSTRTTL